MRLLILIAAALALAPAHAQELVIGGGVLTSVSSAPSMVAGSLGVQMFASQIAASGALTSPGTSCQGTAAFRFKGMYNYSVSSETGDIVDSFILQNGTSGYNETEPGFNIILDSGVGIRFNFGDTTWNGSAGSHFNRDVAKGTSGSFLNDMWNNYYYSWNECTSGTYNFAFYNNNTQFSVGTTGTDTGAPFNIGWTTTTNGDFAVGNSQGGTDNAYFDMDDVVIDATVGTVCTSSSSPSACADVGGVGQCTLSTGGPHCAANMIPDVSLQKFYKAGVPQRINKHSNCDGVTGQQPYMCFTTDGGGAVPTYSTANFQNSMTNLCGGSPCGTAGSTWSYSSAYGAVIAQSGYPPLGSSGLNGQIGMLWATGAQASTSTGSGAAISTTYENHASPAGDLLILTATVNGTSYAPHCPSGWNDVSGADHPFTGTSNTSVACWKVSLGTSTWASQTGQQCTGPSHACETAPSITVSGSPASAQSAAYVIADYQNADATTPIDAWTWWTTSLLASSQPSPQVITSYANDVVLEFVTLPNDNGGSNSVTPPTGARLRYAIPQSSTTSSANLWDVLQASAGQTSVGTFSQTNVNPAAPSALAIALKPATAPRATVHGTFTISGIGGFYAPAQSATATIRCWGSGASGAGGSTGTGPGGGGGGYAEADGVTLAGGTVFFSLPAGGKLGSLSTGNPGSPGWINVAGANASPSDGQGCLAAGGTDTTNNGVNVGGAGTYPTSAGCTSTGLCTGGVLHTGGSGANGSPGAGGGAACSGANGNNASGHIGGAACTTGAYSGGAGGVSGNSYSHAMDGYNPGGAGGGAWTTGQSGGAGANSQGVVTF